jgi:hypothetical protein
MGDRGWGLEVRGWVRVWIRINVWINRRPITTQYFIAYNGITTPIDYWSQRAERLDFSHDCSYITHPSH